MKRAVLLVALISWAGCSSPSAAFQTPGGGVQSTVPYARIQRNDSTTGIDRLQSEAFGRSLNGQVVAPRRMDRAERAAALINEGKCSEAVAFVRAERDRRLIRRVEELCRSST